MSIFQKREMYNGLYTIITSMSSLPPQLLALSCSSAVSVVSSKESEEADLEGKSSMRGLSDMFTMWTSSPSGLSLTRLLSSSESSSSPSRAPRLPTILLANRMSENLEGSKDSAALPPGVYTPRRFRMKWEMRIDVTLSLLEKSYKL